MKDGDNKAIERNVLTLNTKLCEAYMNSILHAELMMDDGFL